VAVRTVSPSLAQLPNALTIFRLALIPPFAAFILASDGGRSWWAGSLFLVAGITDQVDGFLARRWHVESRFGQFADPLAPVDANDTTKQVVTVTPGSTAGDIGTTLQQRGLIRSGLLFRLAAEQAGVGSSLAAGDYELSRSMSTNEIIQVLAKGQVKRGLLATIPEGWRSEQIADRLEATGFASREDFLRAVNAPPSVPGVDLLDAPPPSRLEGYLFPETYEVPQRVSGSRAAELMVREAIRLYEAGHDCGAEAMGTAEPGYRADDAGGGPRAPTFRRDPAGSSYRRTGDDIRSVSADRGDPEDHEGVRGGG